LQRPADVALTKSAAGRNQRELTLSCFAADAASIFRLIPTQCDRIGRSYVLLTTSGTLVFVYHFVTMRLSSSVYQASVVRKKGDDLSERMDNKTFDGGLMAQHRFRPRTPEPSLTGN
jgi:hypothetical protein